VEDKESQFFLCNQSTLNNPLNNGDWISSEKLFHIHPNSNPYRYILTATDYFTKRVESIPLKTTNSEEIIEFIDQFIITRFDVPNTLIFDNASYFSGNSILEFAIKRGFKLKYYANYYPQGNGLT